jgi:hypothetical protein
MKKPHIRPGEYMVIRVDGTETLYEDKPTLRGTCAAIGCDCIDTVILDRENMVVMIVDDTGMVDGKPVNPKATALYHAICKPGTVWAIHGDVAIVNDKDFG